MAWGSPPLEQFIGVSKGSIGASELEVSAPMARRAALYGRNDTAATIEIAGCGLSALLVPRVRKKDQEPEFLREVVEKLVKPRLNLKAAERKPNYKRSASRRRSEQWRSARGWPVFQSPFEWMAQGSSPRMRWRRESCGNGPSDGSNPKGTSSRPEPVDMPTFL